MRHAGAGGSRTGTHENLITFKSTLNLRLNC